ncbi:MAG: glycosyltransferase [Lachnospiraceae bacterium]|nr:glycosyltransferase [Lachnospiraceae bacterium]
MKSIDEKIALSEAQWRRYRYEKAGIPETAFRFGRAVEKGIGKRVRCVFGNINPGMKRTGFKATYDEKKENIVVSLTSTGSRIKNIFPTLYSLALQSRRPDLIVLWLDRGVHYPGGVISQVKALGVTVRYVKDLGPHTKYHYAFAEFKKDVVITVDDDIIYHRNMIKELYAAYLKHPGQVVARRVHRMRFGTNKKPVRYRDWIWEYRDADAPAHDLFATGVGGVLYPPAVMALDCWKSTDFLKVCPKADDIWLKFCELKSGVKVCAVRRAGFLKDSVNLRTLKPGLSAFNINAGRNDRYMRSCAKYFGFTGDLCERILGEY